MWNNEDFWCGRDDLNEYEQRLCSAYERFERPDLAECVRGARLHQRLEMAIGDPDSAASFRRMSSFRPLLAGLHAEYESGLPETMAAWRARLLVAHRDDPDLDGVKALERSYKSQPGWIFRSIPKRHWAKLGTAIRGVRAVRNCLSPASVKGKGSHDEKHLTGGLMLPSVEKLVDLP